MFRNKPGLRSPEAKAEVIEDNPLDYTNITSGINSRIVGTTFSPNGQKTLAQFAELGRGVFEGDNPRFTLFLSPEPSNSFDKDAIVIYAKSNISGKTQQLGHIQNSERKCPQCFAHYEKVRQSKDAKIACERCGTELIRAGLASTLCQRASSEGMDVGKMFNVRINWSAGGVTGGQKDKYTGKQKAWGCNIFITRK